MKIMKKVNLILTTVVVLAIMSFKPSENLSLLTGTYGVCNCDDNSNSTTKTELLINEDNSFHYFDNSNSNKKIDVKGKWIRKGNTIYLQDYNSEFAIHNKWTIDKNEKCLTSRIGLNFTRLCHIKACKENN